MQWYYAKNGQRQGPVEEAQFQELLQSGAIGPDDLVWNQTFGGEWKKAGLVTGMAVVPVLPSAGGKPDQGPFTSRTPNRDLCAAARASLQGNWGMAIGVLVVYVLLVGAVSAVPIIGPIGQLLIDGPLMLGITAFFLLLARGQPAPFATLFGGFKLFGTALGAYLLMAIFTVLWTLLLIVPGIIAALRYSQTYFVLVENPSLGPLEAIRRSKALMVGNKWKYFCLGLRIAAWMLAYMALVGGSALLAYYVAHAKIAAIVLAVVGGLGLIPLYLWIGTVLFTAYAKFYDDLKAAL